MGFFLCLFFSRFLAASECNWIRKALALRVKSSFICCVPIVMLVASFVSELAFCGTTGGLGVLSWDWKTAWSEVWFYTWSDIGFVMQISGTSSHTQVHTERILWLLPCDLLFISSLFPALYLLVGWHGFQLCCSCESERDYPLSLQTINCRSEAYKNVTVNFYGNLRGRNLPGQIKLVLCEFVLITLQFKNASILWPLLNKLTWIKPTFETVKWTNPCLQTWC